jgi:membrane protease YdiL (CAAX protease family)
MWWASLPAITFVATIGAYVTSFSVLGSVLRDSWPLLLAHYLLQFAIVGVGEELGWRGWLLPRLLCDRSRAAAAVLVAAVWYPWHLPILLSDVGIALSFAAIALALSFLFTALWSHTKGSIFVVALAHGSVNAPLFFFEGALGSAAAGAAWYAVCVLYSGAAGLLVASTWQWWRSASSTPDIQADDKALVAG